ncbi:hypothetical protein [Phenylobacterium sp.]|uniref:hypothetical protein n=1 Tax=Phenylobacterium sp. TaxID=1871053 RepID=UPI0035B3364C
MSVTAPSPAAGRNACDLVRPGKRLALFRLLIRLGEEDPQDALALAMLAAELREALEPLAARADAAASAALAEIETLLDAAETADALDRPGLVRLVKVAVSDLITCSGGELAA